MLLHKAMRGGNLNVEEVARVGSKLEEILKSLGERIAKNSMQPPVFQPQAPYGTGSVDIPAYQALAKTLTANQLFYLKEQFELRVQIRVVISPAKFEIGSGEEFHGCNEGFQELGLGPPVLSTPSSRTGSGTPTEAELPRFIKLCTESLRSIPKA
ncbi:hypothetical protein ZWY2020_009376 [Hordeum vulgare]|nr:hypothetical protein ZWY2020_009376 [Hordeum vulgare]